MATTAQRSSWIKVPDADGENITFLARRSFRAEGALESALLRISADWRYALYLNGEFIGSGPARGTHKRYFYDTFDVKALLRHGVNHLAVEVHSPVRPTFTSVSVLPALFVELESLLQSDTQWEVRLDPSRRRGAPVYTPQIGFSEWRDMRRWPAGWRTFEDLEGGWARAELVDAASAPGGRTLVPCDIPELERLKYSPQRMIGWGRVPVVTENCDDDPLFADLMQREPHLEGGANVAFNDGVVSFTPIKGNDSYCILDFGREVYGSLVIEMDSSDGMILDLGYGDALYENRVKTHSDSYRFADRYILSAGRQYIEQRLQDRGFRFLQLVIRRCPKQISIHSITVIGRAYPILACAQFECDDPLLNRLWSMCATTISVCATDTFIDCPWREQAFWVCDTLVVFPLYFSFTNDRFLPARCLRLAADGQRANGLIPSVYPSAEVEHSTFPSMSAIWTLMLADYHFYTEDLEMVRELRPVMESALSVYEKWADSDGLIPDQPGMWNFIEWGLAGSWHDLPPGGKTAPLNILIAAAFKAAAKLHQAAGEFETAAAMQAKSRRLMDAVVARFWDREKECFIDMVEVHERGTSVSQHTHALALYYGLLDEPYRGMAVRALLDPSVVQTDFYYRYFVLQALAQAGCEGEALISIRELWKEMLSDGSPTIWETQKGKAEFNGVGSLCHAFSCAPIKFMQSTLLGIRPIAQGFSEFRIVPPEGLNLNFCRGDIPTPRGMIRIEWRLLREGGFALEVEIPKSTIGLLPSGEHLTEGLHARVLAEDNINSFC